MKMVLPLCAAALLMAACSVRVVHHPNDHVSYRDDNAPQWREGECGPQADPCGPGHEVSDPRHPGDPGRRPIWPPEPIDPGRPGPVTKDPTKPKKPAKPIHPTKPIRPKHPGPVVKDPARPKKPARPIHPTKPIKPKRPGPVVKDPSKPNKPIKRKLDPKVVKHRKNADEFVSAVLQLRAEVERSRAWEFTRAAFKKYEKAYENALKRKKQNGKISKLERAWADCISDWYEFKYSSELYRFKFGILNFGAVVLGDRPGVLKLSDRELRSQDRRLKQAAVEAIKEMDRKAKQFKTDVIKYDLVAARVFSGKTWAKHLAKSKERWKGALRGIFDAKDLKKVNRKPRGPGEKAPSEKAEEEPGKRKGKGKR